MAPSFTNYSATVRCPAAQRALWSALAGAACAVICSATASAQPLQRLPTGDAIQDVSGQCTAETYIAEGAVGLDLSARRSRIFCDSAVIIHYRREPGHVLIHFSEKGSHTSVPIGFGAHEKDRDSVLNVKTVYLAPRQKTLVDEGRCEVRRERGRISRLSCKAIVDQGGRRTLVNIEFVAELPR